MNEMKAFTIRVYGLLHNTEGEVLVLTENIAGKPYNKFPGGGLELGEGLRDALKREFKEELGIEVELGDHLYTTDRFIESTFKTGYQVLAIYYAATTQQEITIMDPDITATFWKKSDTTDADLSLESDRIVWNLQATKRRAALVKKRLCK